VPQSLDLRDPLKELSLIWPSPPQRVYVFATPEGRLEVWRFLWSRDGGYRWTKVDTLPLANLGDAI